MAGSERKPETNTLDRFVKRSPQFLREMYTSCEVPAGCIGVVFRWRHAQSEYPIQCHAYGLPEHFELYVQGKLHALARMLVAPGPCVLGLVLPSIPSRRAFGLALRFLDRRESVQWNARSEPVLALTRADGSWLARREDPGDEWLQPDAPLEGWSPLALGSAPTKTKKNEYDWNLRRTNEAGVEWLAAPAGKGPLWIRTRFELPTPGPDGALAPEPKREEKK